MSKAELKAKELYPEKMAMNKKETGQYDKNYQRRKAFQEGYEQAEKDLALTPDDIKLITKIHYEIVFKDTTGVKVGDIPSEVLRRFNEQKE